MINNARNEATIEEDCAEINPVCRSICSPLQSPPRRSRQEKSSASVSWIQALLLVWQGFWRHFGKNSASLVGSKGKTSPSSTDLPSKSLNACLSLQRNWFVSR